MKTAALLLGLLVACSLPAGAAERTYLNPNRSQESPYIGFDYVAATLQLRDADMEMSGGRLRIGTEFNSYLGLEYQGTLGRSDSEESAVTGGTISTHLKAATGIYLRGKIPFGESGGIYGLLGYSWSWLEINTQAFGLEDQTIADSDLSGAIGIEFGVPKSFYVNAEYIEFTEGLTAVAAGMRFPF